LSNAEDVPAPSHTLRSPIDGIIGSKFDREWNDCAASEKSPCGLGIAIPSGPAEREHGTRRMISLNFRKPPAG
jgi:hypothetical protein